MATIKLLLAMIVLSISGVSYGDSLNYAGTFELYVPEIDAAKTQLSSTATAWGGYITQDTGTQLKIAIPQARFLDFGAYLQEVGSLAGRTFDSAVMDQKLTEKRAALKSRQTMLTRYLAALDQSASREDFTEVQGQLQRLVYEIEAHQSEIRQLSRQARFATLIVNFTQTTQKAVVQERNDSPFPWINTVKVGRLLEDF